MTARRYQLSIYFAFLAIMLHVLMPLLHATMPQSALRSSVFCGTLTPIVEYQLSQLPGSKSESVLAKAAPACVLCAHADQSQAPAVDVFAPMLAVAMLPHTFGMPAPPVLRLHRNFSSPPPSHAPPVFS
ncbi:hypothetical protein [Iodobacter fluviatilis]|uniref:DUF2946 domain-containing protein n=1 Tax=Iodobacter fluviatilis TaxID=537 RepID=A0A377Q4Z6_9NEIS|nr:hypothetical protein [Iodobacter fluviatilis]TCU86963.1 hypothetical protein EV682_10588 [Iodobacter fluviatilis]STQ90294.1 Uncharacterised protein [Iodobacter fluviatilis]